MVSYDVTSLFTNIPLNETIDLAIDLIFQDNPGIKISRGDLKELFRFATCQSHFLFDGNFYDQIDGVAMGSPLGPVLANLFMAIKEKEWLNNCDSPPLFYRRYVDDIFCLVKDENEANSFLSYLNARHPNIKFKIELEKDKKLSFSDILISSKNGGFQTSVHRKDTFYGLFMNYRSFLPTIYKLGLVNTLIDRVFKIAHNRTLFYFEMKKVKEFLGKNSYPPHLVDKQMRKYIRKADTPQTQSKTSADTANIYQYL